MNYECIGFLKNSMCFIISDRKLHGNIWIGDGLGVREHPQCLVVNLEGCSYIQQKTFTSNKVSSGKNLTIRVCW